MAALLPIIPAPDSALTVAKPECVLIELTNLCNLECTTCPRNDQFGDEMKKGSMNLESLRQIVDEIVIFARKIVLIGLGETLLYRRLLEAVDYIYHANPAIELAITTNATLPNSAALLSQVCQKLKTAIMFSIDGTGETYNRIRRGGSYEVFVATTSAILRSAPAAEFSFNMVVFKENYLQMVLVLELAETLGVRAVNFNSLNLAALPQIPLSAYRFYETEEFRLELRRAHDRARGLGITLTTFDFETTGSFQKCKYPWDSFYITWEGFLVQCCAQPFPQRKHFGNVLEKGVWNCINSKEFLELRRMWRNNVTPQLCARCHKVEIPAIRDLGDVMISDCAARQ